MTANLADGWAGAGGGVRQSGRRLAEEVVWRRVDGEWRVLHGGIAGHGVSIEWHDFTLDGPLAWSQSFHPESLEICLNFQGVGEFESEGGAVGLGPGQAALYTIGRKPRGAVRKPGGWHRFLTIEVTAAYLQGEFRERLSGLRPCIREFCERPSDAVPTLVLAEIPAQLLALRSQMLEPPVAEPAAPHWYRGKLLEVFSHFLYCPGGRVEMFCERQKRLNRERVNRVLHLLQRDMENPPSLDMLAAEADCSPFHLSRLFAAEMGISIPAALRRMRMDKAADILASGKSSVTQAAFAVGYSSLGAFYKAFHQQFGRKPGDFVQSPPPKT